MNYKYRGFIKNSKDIVDILEINGEIVRCTDSIDRNLDDFNSFLIPLEQFKKENLSIIPTEETILEKQTAKKTSK